MRSCTGCDRTRFTDCHHNSVEYTKARAAAIFSHAYAKVLNEPRRVKMDEMNSTALEWMRKLFATNGFGV